MTRFIGRFLVVCLLLMLALPPLGPKASAQDLTRLVRCIKPAVLFLSVARTDGKLVSGTGFIVTEDGRFITSLHVVKGANRIFVRMTDGTKQEARVVGTFEEMDLAVGVLTTRGRNYPRVALEMNPERPVQGEEVLVFGYPAGHALGVEDVTVTRGIVSAVREHFIFQIDAAVNPGNSGGPVVSIQDQVVTGVAFAQLRNSSGINFAISTYALRVPFLGLNESLLLWGSTRTPSPDDPSGSDYLYGPPGSWCKRI